MPWRAAATNDGFVEIGPVRHGIGIAEPGRIQIASANKSRRIIDINAGASIVSGHLQPKWKKPMTAYPVTESFAAEIGDIDLSKPLSSEERSEIEAAFNRYSVLVFPDQHLSTDQHLLYARSIPPVGGQTEFADMRAAYDALPDETKQRLRGLVAEHAIMYSRKKLGFTDFSDEENQTLPPVPQVMVRRHAGSGRMGLYLASHAGRIFGMKEDDGQALLLQLIEHATK